MIDAIASIRTYVQTRQTVEQGFAPVRYKAVCVSRAGRRREEHEYDRDGVCYFCDSAEKRKELPD